MFSARAQPVSSRSALRRQVSCVNSCSLSEPRGKPDPLQGCGALGDRTYSQHAVNVQSLSLVSVSRTNPRVLAAFPSRPNLPLQARPSRCRCVLLPDCVTDFTFLSSATSPPVICDPSLVPAAPCAVRCSRQLSYSFVPRQACPDPARTSCP